jgi:hypothetical protein
MIVLAMYTLNALHPGFLLVPEENRMAAEQYNPSSESTLSQKGSQTLKA